MEDNLLYYLGFSCFSGIGPMKFNKLVASFKSVQKAYWAPENELGLIVDVDTARRFISFRNKFDPVKRLEEFNKMGIRVLSRESENYPANLKNISDPPVCLFVKGILKESRFFAIVGTRQPTLYGQTVAYELAHGLAKSGFTIVSGMAQGIDGVAHWAAIDAGSSTIAVLGCVDFVYPAFHADLYQKIIESGGAVISEFPPGSNVIKGMFVSRNRLISGLSDGVLVVEGGGHSGTLITASYAANQGKDIFAVPGQITTDAASAPNILLKQGAKMVTELEDILEEYGMESRIKRY